MTPVADAVASWLRATMPSLPVFIDRPPPPLVRAGRRHSCGRCQAFIEQGQHYRPGTNRAAICLRCDGAA